MIIFRFFNGTDSGDLKTDPAAEPADLDPAAEPAVPDSAAVDCVTKFEVEWAVESKFAGW